MDNPEQGFLLQIIDEGRVVAEAPLVIHDVERAWALFSEGFGMMNHIIAGSVYNTVRVACNAETLAQVGPQTAIKLEQATPSKIVVPKLNGKVDIGQPAQG